jgi:hypothetical protein
MSFSFDETGELVGPGIPRSPALHRVFAVAAGLSKWNKEEEAWIAEHPNWLEYCNQFKRTIKEADTIPHHRTPTGQEFADLGFRV